MGSDRPGPSPVSRRRALLRRLACAAVGATLGLATVWAGAGPPKPPGVWGDDDRVITDSTAWPWSAIGRVNSTLGGHCTGTVIGPRKVLTAAHCLWNRGTGRWLPACGLHFLAGYRRGDYLVHALVESFRVSPGFVAGADGRPRDLGQDWAILYLAADVTARTGAIEPEPFSPAQAPALGAEGRVLLRAGYGRDRRHVLYRHEGCRVVGWSAGGRVALHDCDATHGDSGSPILARAGADYRLLGIHVAHQALGPDDGVGAAVPSIAFLEAAREPAPPLLPGRKIEACALPGLGLSDRLARR